MFLSAFLSTACIKTACIALGTGCYAPIMLAEVICVACHVLLRQASPPAFELKHVLAAIGGESKLSKLNRDGAGHCVKTGLTRSCSKLHGCFNPDLVVKACLVSSGLHSPHEPGHRSSLSCNRSFADSSQPATLICRSLRACGQLPSQSCMS